jgi:hypothetical protein
MHEGRNDRVCRISVKSKTLSNEFRADLWTTCRLFKFFSIPVPNVNLEEVDKDLFNSCLNELSYYCTFVYSKSDEETYSDLNKQLGATIQKDIHEVRYLSFNNDSSLYRFCKGIMSSLGKCMY